MSPTMLTNNNAPLEIAPAIDAQAATVLEMPEQEPEPEGYAKFREELDQIRRGYVLEKGKPVIGKDGEPLRQPAHLAERDMWLAFRRFLNSRGKIFRAGFRYIFDVHDGRLMRIDYASPEFALILRCVGLLAGQKHTKIIEHNLADHGAISTRYDLHRLSYFGPPLDRRGKDDGERKVYLNIGDSRMLRISAAAIEQVKLGTDGVILLSDEVGPWPSLADLRPHLDAIRPVLDRTTLRPIPACIMHINWSNLLPYVTLMLGWGLSQLTEWSKSKRDSKSRALERREGRTLRRNEFQGRIYFDYRTLVKS